MSSPPNPFASSPSPQSSPLPSSPRIVPTPPRSGFSAASGSPPPTHRASFPDPASEPKGTKLGDRLVGPKVKNGPCCDKDRDIAKGEEIHIIDAFKTTEGGKVSYITYVIQLGTHQTRRRYSSFLSLHQALTGLYPVLIIPPIPSKQSLAEYAVKGQSKAKEDATTIARRKRLLEDFLQRLVRHPILGGEHVLHRFLEDGVSWSEVINSPPVSLLPKNPLHTPSHNPTFQPASPTSPSGSTSPGAGGYIAHHLLPTPSPSHPLKNPDPRFEDSEAFTDKFEKHFSGTMEKVNRRVVKRWGERGQDMSELGGVWNGYSLVEGGKLGLAVEKVGQAVDQEYLATAALLQAWEHSTTEPMHIYAQFGALIKARLSFRHQKQVQYEMVKEALNHQKDKLASLESAELESRRLDEALERGGKGLGNSVSNLTDEERIAQREQERERERERLSQQSSSSRSAGAKGGFGLFNAVKHSLSGMMDVDPEATRRANIGKTRDNISQLEDSLQASEQDLKYASTTLQADLDRFQRQKVADLRHMTIQLAQIHREWCKQNLEAWQAAQAAIRDIEPHPNQPPSSAAHSQPAKLFDQSQGLPSPVGSASPSSASTSRPSGSDSMFLGRIRDEIDQVEAANIPLPLPQDDHDQAQEESSGGSGFSPLGPL